MKRYIPVSEDAEYREFYDSYRITVDNLNDTDFLYKTSLTTGQVYFANDEVYGQVNGQPAPRNQNITITSDNINNFTIRDFILYNRMTNSLITLDITCNLNNYRDGKIHYLYVVLSGSGTYEVYDDMFHTNNARILFARFLIGTDGNSEQFYVILPFAGSADYLKGNQFYQVMNGLDINIVSTLNKQINVTDAKIRFSGINFDDEYSPDCLPVTFGGNATPIRYVTWNSTYQMVTGGWDEPSILNLIVNKKMNYTTGAISNVTANEFTIQKLYYDVYTRCIVAMYGDASYADMDTAISNLESVINYPLPDNVEYMIPIAAVIIKNSSEALSDSTFKVINLDYNEKEVLDTDTYTRQLALEAVNRSNTAIQDVGSVSSSLTQHTGNMNNPHQVKLNQLYNSVGTQISLDDSYANYTPATIISSVIAQVGTDYYAKSGGTISGNVEIGTQSASRNLTVWGTSALKGNVTLNGTLTLGGNVSGAYDFGSSSASVGTIYAQALNVRAGAIIGDQITTRAILPSTANAYPIGASNKRYSIIYGNTINATTGQFTNVSASGNLSVSGNITSGNITLDTNKKLIVDNGYIIIGNKALCLGKISGLPVADGYAIDI